MRLFVRRSTAFILALAIIIFSIPRLARADPVSLFDSRGSPAAYIDTDDEFTIFLWNGLPVAYLANRDAEVFNVWGFNGRHLGWFENGAVWDRSGNASCVVREAFSGITSIEPIKSIRQIKPLKSIKEVSAAKPIRTGRFGELPCSGHLSSGRY